MADAADNGFCLASGTGAGRVIMFAVVVMMMLTVVMFTVVMFFSFVAKKGTTATIATTIRFVIADSL